MSCRSVLGDFGLGVGAGGGERGFGGAGRVVEAGTGSMLGMYEDLMVNG